MGCVCNCKSSKSSGQSTQLSINMAEQYRNNRNINTQDSLEDIYQSLCNIGQEITSLGQLRPEVQEKLNELGTFKAIENIDTDTSNYKYLQCSDGSLFYGLVINGVRNGIGKQHWLTDGNYLESVWVNDKANGPARMIYSNGDVFEGHLIQNKANGFGIFKNKKKEVRGYWIDNRLQGNGIEVRKNGIKYEGQFKCGIIDGRGQYSFPDGRKYCGQVKQGLMHGEGLMTWPDYSYFKGEFRNNHIKGYGCYTHTDSEIYFGYFFSIYHQDVKQLEIFYSNDPNIQECKNLKNFKKQYGGDHQ
ncbi:unnamed protein product [Paramecium pentaurelia]|uniref:MORN repeat protein n=1 Tax=Paramecium pentaurelia TaxID=43138 RepID=A0A8S1VNT0_9CILI|nr:unnamed protein product [Paramecium pentaurelia]